MISDYCGWDLMRCGGFRSLEQNWTHGCRRKAEKMRALITGPLVVEVASKRSGRRKTGSASARSSAAAAHHVALHDWCGRADHGALALEPAREIRVHALPPTTVRTDLVLDDAFDKLLGHGHKVTDALLFRCPSRPDISPVWCLPEDVASAIECRDGRLRVPQIPHVRRSTAAQPTCDPGGMPRGGSNSTRRNNG